MEQNCLLLIQNESTIIEVLIFVTYTFLLVLDNDDSIESFPNEMNSYTIAPSPVDLNISINYSFFETVYQSTTPYNNNIPSGIPQMGSGECRVYHYLVKVEMLFLKDTAQINQLLLN